MPYALSPLHQLVPPSRARDCASLPACPQRHCFPDTGGAAEGMGQVSSAGNGRCTGLAEPPTQLAAPDNARAQPSAVRVRSSRRPRRNGARRRCAAWAVNGFISANWPGPDPVRAADEGTDRAGQCCAAVQQRSGGQWPSAGEDQNYSVGVGFNTSLVISWREGAPLHAPQRDRFVCGGHRAPLCGAVHSFGPGDRPRPRRLDQRRAGVRGSPSAHGGGWAARRPRTDSYAELRGGSVVRYPCGGEGGRGGGTDAETRAISCRVPQAPLFSLARRGEDCAMHTLGRTESGLWARHVALRRRIGAQSLQGSRLHGQVHEPTEPSLQPAGAHSCGERKRTRCGGVSSHGTIATAGKNVSGTRQPLTPRFPQRTTVPAPGVGFWLCVASLVR